MPQGLLESDQWPTPRAREGTYCQGYLAREKSFCATNPQKGDDVSAAIVRSGLIVGVDGLLWSNAAVEWALRDVALRDEPLTPVFVAHTS